MTSGLYYFSFWTVFGNWLSLFNWLCFSFWHFHMFSCMGWIFKQLRSLQVILGTTKISSAIFDFLCRRISRRWDFFAAQGSWSSVGANAHSNHKIWKLYCLYSDKPFHMKTKILNATDSCRNLSFFWNKPNQ